MANFKKQTVAGTNVQKVQQQNAQAAKGPQAGAQAGAGQFGTEFASSTDAQQVRQQNAQAEQNKQQNS